MSNRYEVVVVGAGAGGLIAATCLGRQGRKVLLLDKTRATAHTFKGELLQPRSLITLDQLGLLDPLMAAGGQRINRLVSCDARGAEFCAMDYRWLGKPYDHCVTHTYQTILETMVAALPPTVELWRGVAVEHALMNETGLVEGVQLTNNGRRTEVRADLVVASDGYSSKLRKQAGVPASAIEYEHQVVAFDLADQPHLDSQATTVVTPQGMRVMYPMPDGGGRLYMQIPRGMVNRIGKQGLLSWFTQTARECEALAPVADAALRSLPTSRILSARRFVAPVFHAHAIPLVGDAAHAVHPMAGQGMNAAIADGAALAAAFDGVDLGDARACAIALARYDAVRRPAVRTLSEFSHRFAALFTETSTRASLARTRYVLSCHGRNPRLCYKIMHNISGLGYQHFTVRDRLQQLGLPDRNAHRVPRISV